MSIPVKTAKKWQVNAAGKHLNEQQACTTQLFSVPVPIRGLTYCEGIRSGSEKDWERMLEMYQRETVQVERDRLLAALTCSHDAYTLKRFVLLQEF